MRVLIIALSGIGDALLFTPAAKLIRKHLPQATVDALVMFKGAREIYSSSGLFDDVLFHDFMNSSRIGSLKFVMNLRGKYDASINVYPSNRIEYNFIQFLIGAKKRGAIQYLRRDAREFGFLNNVRMLEDDSLHNVQENILLAKKLFGLNTSEEPDLTLAPTEEEKKYARDFFISHGIKDNEIVVGFHAGSATLKNQAKRRWEPEKFAALGRRLIDEMNARILLFGGPDEADLNDRIKNGIASDRIFIPKTDGIGQAAALIGMTTLFVTNDSGMMHIASAMKRNVVAIIGPTSTAYIHPWHTEYRIASLNLECSPCFIYSPRPLKCFRNDVKFKCIKELTADIVYSQVKAFLR